MTGETRRVPALDGLRGLAIGGVLAVHAGWLVGGHLGVTVFFTLSGYLITTLLLREHDRTGGVDLAGFYRRRVRRLGPALLVVLAFSAALALYLGKPRLAFMGTVTTLTFSTGIDAANRSAGQVGNLYLYTWSLGVEELFYLAWPGLIVAAGFARPSLRRIAWVLAAGSVAARVMVMRHHYGVGIPSDVYTLWTRADALALGCLLALGAFRWVSARLGYVGLAMLAGLYATAHYSANWSYTVGVLAAAVATVLVLRAVEDGRLPWLGWAPLVRVGVISYGLYLWNMPLQELWRTVAGEPPAGWLAVPWVLACYLVAEASWWIVERPIVKGAPVRFRRQGSSRTDAMAHPSTP